MSDKKEYRQTIISEMLYGCPRLVEYWLSGKKFPAYARMITGTSLHKGFEKNNANKLEKGIDLPAKEVSEISIETFKTIIKNEDFIPSPDYANKDEEKNQYEQYLLKLSGNLSENVCPKIIPVEIEKQYRIELPDAIINGTVDVTTAKKTLEDLKSVYHAPDKNKYKFQMTFYSLLLYKHKNEIYKPVVNAIQIHDKKKTGITTENHTLEFDIVKENYGQMIKQINYALKMLAAGIFPANTLSWKCSPKWCAYNFMNECEYARKDI